MDGHTRRILARLAHRSWCDAAFGKGWKYGPEFDPARKTHDALVPFGRLDPTDQWCVILAVECSDVERTLSELADYPRGPTQIFRPQEMRVGLRVTPADVVPEEGVEPDIGRVVEWEVGGEPRRVITVTVLWGDGMRTVHYPEERDLRRVV